MPDHGTVSFLLKEPEPRFRVHLLLLVVLVHATCDLCKCVFTNLGKLFDKINFKLTGRRPRKLTLKDFNIETLFASGNLTPFRILKGLTVALVFFSEFLLPYYLFNKSTKVLRTNFERQVDSFGPLTLVTCRAPVLRDFTLGKRELDALISEDYEAEKQYSLNRAELFESVDKLEDDTTEKVEEPVKQQVLKDPKKARSKLPDAKTNALNLQSFNRFVSFSLSKVALHGLYVSVHALLRPHTQTAFLNSFKKKR